MEKLLIRPYDKEYMKMAMLKHEETFKEQVYELHRLYRIQKILMKSIGSGISNGGNTLNMSSHSSKKDEKSVARVDLERPVEDCNAESDGAGEALDTIEESQIELTLGLGPTTYCGRSRPKKPADTSTHLTSDSVRSSFSSSSTGSTRSSGTRWGSENTIKLGSLDGVVIEEDSRRERMAHPPWIFQVLSLNST